MLTTIQHFRNSRNSAMNANEDINIKEKGHWWNGNGFFELERTHRWFIGLYAAILGSFGLFCYVFGSYVYDLATMHDDPHLVWAIPVLSAGILIFFSVLSWACFNLSQVLQNFKNYSSMLMRVNAIYTAFAGVLYTMLSLMQMGRPLVFIDNLPPVATFYVLPLVLMILMKFYIAVKLYKMFKLNLGLSMIVFWSMLIITALALYVDGIAHPDYSQLFDGWTISLAVLTGVAGCNLLFSCSATTMKLSSKKPEA